MAVLKLFESSYFKFYLRKDKKEIERDGAADTRDKHSEREFFLQTREEKSVANGEEHVGVLTSTTTSFFE